MIAWKGFQSPKCTVPYTDSVIMYVIPLPCARPHHVGHTHSCQTHISAYISYAEDQQIVQSSKWYINPMIHHNIASSSLHAAN